MPPTNESSGVPNDATTSSRNNKPLRTGAPQPPVADGPKVHRPAFGQDTVETGEVSYTNTSEETVVLEGLRPIGDRQNKRIEVTVGPGEKLLIPNLPAFTRWVARNAPQLKADPDQQIREFDYKAYTVRST